MVATGRLPKIDLPRSIRSFAEITRERQEYQIVEAAEWRALRINAGPAVLKGPPQCRHCGGDDVLSFRCPQ